LIVESIEAWLGPTVSVNVHAREGLFPAVISIIHPQFSVAILDGTRDFQTLALEGFQQFRRPTDFGIYGTLPLWYNAATHVNEILEADGAIAAAPVMLVGHSYGGAVAVNLAARYAHANPLRIIRFMTWGLPKPGDERLAKLIDSCEGINLVNDDDLVTVLPPDEATLLPVMIFLALPGLSVYTEWVRPKSQVLLRQDGSLANDEDPILDFGTLLPMVQRAIGDLQQFVVIGHRSPEYFRRTSLRCPRKEWPVNKKAWEDLQQPLPEFVLTSPIVPRTALVWTRPIPPDGSSCGNAIPLTIGVLHTIVPTRPFAWFEFSGLAVRSYTATLTYPDWAMSSGLSVASFKGDCSGNIDETELAFDGQGVIIWTSAGVIGGKIKMLYAYASYTPFPFTVIIT
jgi:pimeloyl-ACP methyl ester carboxylesterase